MFLYVVVHNMPDQLNLNVPRQSTTCFAHIFHTDPSVLQSEPFQYLGSIKSPSNQFYLLIRTLLLNNGKGRFKIQCCINPPAEIDTNQLTYQDAFQFFSSGSNLRNQKQAMCIIVKSSENRKIF